MLERLKNNWSAKLIAFGLAALLWMYVNIQDNPQTEEIYSNIPVEVTGLAQNFTLTTNPPPVQVRVTGTRPSLAALNQRDIRAYIDLSQVTSTTVIVPVNVVVPGTVEVVSIFPAQVNIQMEQIVEQRWPVVIKVVGRLAEDYVYGQPEASPDFVFIQGSEGALADIKEVFVAVELSEEIQEDLVLQLPVEVVNQANLPVTPQVRPNPQWVEVFVPVEKQLATSTLPIKISLVGEVEPGFQVQEVILEPELITITGPGHIINDLEEVFFGEVNIAGLEETKVIEVEPVLPEQVEVVGIEVVTVTIIVEEAAAAEE